MRAVVATVFQFSARWLAVCVSLLSLCWWRRARCPQVASAIFVLDLKGKILISRDYRGDVPKSAIDKYVVRAWWWTVRWGLVSNCFCVFYGKSLPVSRHVTGLLGIGAVGPFVAV